MDNQKRHLLIFFKTGGVVKIEELPAGFNFLAMCTEVRATGFFNNGVFYVPHDAINGMAYVLSEQDIKWAPNDGRSTTLQ